MIVFPSGQRGATQDRMHMLRGFENPTTITKGEWRSGLARVAHNHEVDCSIQSSPISSIAQLAEHPAVNR